MCFIYSIIYCFILVHSSSFHFVVISHEKEVCLMTLSSLFSVSQLRLGYFVGFICKESLCPPLDLFRDAHKQCLVVSRESVFPS